MIFAGIAMAAAAALTSARWDELSDLGATDPAARSTAYASLAKAGEGAVAKALEAFSGAPPIARELRARLLKERGSLAVLGAAAELVRDSSPIVRAEFASYLSRPDFAYAQAERRCELLLMLARDADPDVRRVALQGLLRLSHRAAMDGLAELARSGDEEQRDFALRALAATPGSAPKLLAMRGWFASAMPRSNAQFLAALGATGSPEVLPALQAYAVHPTDGVGARVGFDLLARQLLFRRQDADYLSTLTAWEKVDPTDVALRRMRFEMLVRVDMGGLRRAAQELDRIAAAAGETGRENRVQAMTALAVAEMADGHGARAEQALATAYGITKGGREKAVAEGEEVRHLVSLAYLRTLSAFNALLNPAPDAPNAEIRVAEAYVLHKERMKAGVLEGLKSILLDDSDPIAAQIRQSMILSGRPLGLRAPWSFDSAFEYDVGIDTLISVVFARRGRGASALAAGMRLLELLGMQNPHEFVVPGVPDVRSFMPNPIDELLKYRCVPGYPILFSEERIAVQLATPASQFPRDLGRVARGALGDLESAGRLLDAVIERANGSDQLVDLFTYVDASLERAGVAMDAGDPDLSDKYIDAVLERLDAVKETHEASFDRDAVKQLGGAVPEARTAEAKQWLDAERRLRSQALITKAVNTNVVRGDPKRAAGFAKKGVELEPTEFNRVLLACYLAREGNGDDARAILRDAPDTPGTLYNLACTYALLGEKEPALRYLERDFQENHSDVGGLERQRAWARKDPDLKSLRGEPRFEALVQSIPEGSGKPPGK